MSESNSADPAWSRARPASLPQPTSWPMLLALAVVNIAVGIVFSWWFLMPAIAVFVVALNGWIGELRNEHGRE